MTPRINLRSGSASAGFADGQVGVGPRSPDGRPFLFEVLGPTGPESSHGASATAAEVSEDVCRRGGSSSLETCPPPTLDVRRWTEAIGSDFMVRSASYLTTRVKVPSAKQVRLCCVWWGYVVGWVRLAAVCHLWFVTGWESYLSRVSFVLWPVTMGVVSASQVRQSWWAEGGTAVLLCACAGSHNIFWRALDRTNGSICPRGR